MVPLGRTTRGRGRGCTQGGDDGHQRGQLLRGGVALHDPQQRGPLVARAPCTGRACRDLVATAHSGMFPCFFGGRVSRLVPSSRSALTTSSRVSCGGMTPSTYPRSAAVYGLASVSSYSVISSARRASGSSADFSSLR